MPGPAKKPKNLLLPPEAIERGERYSATHDTNVSRLVADFLLSLPLDDDSAPLSPVVARLRGVAAGSRLDRENYHRHLHKKYGTR